MLLDGASKEADGGKTIMKPMIDPLCMIADDDSDVLDVYLSTTGSSSNMLQVVDHVTKIAIGV